MNSRRDTALGYFYDDYVPVPVPDYSKAPNLPNWQRLEVNEETIDAHFAGPGNIGLRLGESGNGLIDVDLDCDEAVALAPLYLQETGWVHGRSSRPGSHYLYICDKPPPSKKFQLRGGDVLVELRSTGCQTVVPPSRYADDEVLSFNQHAQPARVRAEDLQENVGRLAAASLVLRNYPKVGGRHDFALVLAGLLVRAGWDKVDFERFLRPICDAAGDDEISDRLHAWQTTERRIASGRTATGAPSLIHFMGPDAVANLQEWLGVQADLDNTWNEPLRFDEQNLPPFPVHCFPPWVRTFVEAQAVSKQTPLDLPAMVALGTCSAAVAGRVKVQLKKDWSEPLNLYATVALDPSSLKSPIFSACARPLFDFQKELRAEMAPFVAKAEEESAFLEGKLKDLRKQAQKAEGEDLVLCKEEIGKVRLELEEHEVPTLPRIVCDDATPEEVESIMGKNSGRLALISAEGGGPFGIMAGKYSNGQGSFEVFLKAYSGDPLMVDRVNRDSVHIDEPCLTMVLTVQPEVLRFIGQRRDMAGRGLLARFLFALPDSLVGQRDVDAPAVPDDAAAAYAHQVRRMLGVGFCSPINDGHVNFLQLSKGAASRFQEFRRHVEQQLAEGGDLESLRDFGGKLGGTVARIAGVLHCMAPPTALPWESEVPEEVMNDAIAIGMYLIEHWRAASDELGFDEAAHGARAIVRWISRFGLLEFSRGDLHQGVRLFRGKHKALDQALDCLVERNYIRPASQLRRTGGRPPSRFEVNPAVMESTKSTKPIGGHNHVLP